MGATATRTSCGINKFYSTHKPDNTNTIFVGVGDHATNGIFQGNRLLFKLTSSDASKSITLSFNENFFIKDGYIIPVDAPFGAYLTIEVLDGSDNVVSTFAHKISIYGSHPLYINSEDRTGLIPSTYKIKVTIGNSSGTGDEDAAAAFKVSGHIEMYRASTI